MKILIIEDDLLTIEAVAQIVALRWPEATLVSTSRGKTGIEMARKEQPEVILLDIGLPDKSGFQVLEGIRSFSDVPVIIVSARGGEIDKIKGLELGADDYIEKPFLPGEFLARIKAVLRRKQSAKEQFSVLNRPFITGKLRIDFASQEVCVGDVLLELSPTDHKILRELVSSRGELVSKETLIENVWGTEQLNSVEYLDVRVKDLKRKLEKELDYEILFSEGNGYRMKLTGE